MNKEVSTERGKKVIPVALTPVSLKSFSKIKASPKGDWGISDIETACAQLGMTCSAPSRGSHYKVSSPHKAMILTIPYNKPIKLCYIRQFLTLAEAHIKMSSTAEKAND